MNAKDEPERLASVGLVSSAVAATACVEHAVPGATAVPLDSLVALATKQLSSLQLVAGSRLALWRLPTATALGLMFAADIAGVVLVWCNDRWGADETTAAVRRARVSWVLVGQDSASPESRAAANHVTRENPAGCINPEEGVGLLYVVDNADEGSALAAADWRIVRPSTRGVDSDVGWPRSGGTLPYAIYFTSGTTGEPKGVVLSHAAMLSQAQAKLAHVGYNRKTRYLHLAPLFHLGGASSAVAVALAGGSIVLPRRCDASADAWLRCIDTGSINTLVVVPAVLQLLLDAHDDVGKTPTSASSRASRGVETILYGGGSCTRALRASVTRAFPKCKRMIGAYGMTEAASSMTFLDHSTLPARSRLHASVGRAPRHVDLAVKRVADSFSAPGGWLVGEIVTRGPHVMDGYFGEEEATRAALGGGHQSGWLATGDMGYVDGNGYLFLVGRLKDMIKSGGENVFAGEVEGVLARHPSVVSSAVVGLPHRVLGEAVCAAVIMSGVRTGGESLTAWCRKRLSPYKCPKWIVPVDRFPSNPTGKVIKSALRNELRGRLTAHPKL